MVAGTTSSVFINEIHYDNDGTDAGEFVEIANTAGVDLTGWTLVLYNGSGGVSYATYNLTGTGTLLSILTPGIQNGAPDGIALVDNNGNVVQFLSYEGSFTATNGPASGLTSTDIGVSEAPTSPIGQSLQLTGTGSAYGDFAWQASADDTPGAANVSQTLLPPTPPPADVIFINEFHYDNAGTDAGEFIEVAGTAGLDLTGYSLVLYNGSGGAPYTTINLTGTIDDEGSGFGAVNFALPVNGLQNGSPDGIALVDPDGKVIEFLSYEGSFTAVGGAADGLTSTDVGVSEIGAETIGQSLQRTGSGDEASDFTWTGPADDSPGTLNAGQSLPGGALNPGALSIDDVAVTEGDSGTASLVFTVTRTGGSDGAVSADYAVAFDGNADAGDLTGPTSGTLTFADGETSKTITITVNGDTDIEDSETFSVSLSNPTGGVTIDDATGVGTITNDDFPPQGPAQVFINEIHYDNTGADAGEGIEIAGPAGTNLTGWSLVLYNGNGGVVYDTELLGGTIPDLDSGFGTLSFPIGGIQNGSPDGIALVDPSGNVVQFLSYEGTMTATNGPAAGLTSEDIGVSEDGVPLGTSLQLGGTGSVYNDFTWQNAQGQTFGAVNAGQSFTPANPNGTLYIGDASIAEGDSGTSLITFNLFRTGGTTGAASVDFAVNFGTGFQNADAGDFSGATSGSVSFADGQSFKTITLAISGDTAPEPAERFDVVLSNPTGGATIGDGTGRGLITNDDPLNLQIGQIQGAGHTSPFLGNEVTTTGIVTAVASNGFYVQDADGDGDATTSDGIFVFTGSAPSVTAGDAVTVKGAVSEFRPGNDPSNLTITQLTSAAITIESSGNALPASVLIGPGGVTPPTEVIEDDGFTSYDPSTDGIDFWESLEGMLVTIQKPVAVDATSNFGELWTVASDGAGNFAGTNVSDAGLLVIEGGAGGLGEFDTGAGSDFNPERIQIDVAGALNGTTFVVPDVTPGAVLGDVTGIVDYAFGNFEVRPTASVSVSQASGNIAEVTTLASGAANVLAVATYNILNFDINEADGDTDIADGRLSLIASHIGLNLAAPDIVVLQEVQDDSGSANDGTVSAQLTLEAIAQEIFAQTGVLYSVFDNPFVVDGQTGGQPGGNIRVAFLYRGDRVDLDEASVFTITDGSGNLDPAFGNARAPLGATFAFNGEDVTVIGNHFTSKIGSDTSFSANQPPVNAGALARAAQAAAVNDFIDDFLAADSDANIIVAGDFNEFQFEEPMEVLTGALDFNGGLVSPGSGAVLENLTFGLAVEERYSVIFEGNAQALDHILATGNLAEGAQIDIVHTNTTTGFVASDHDPVLALFTIGLRDVIGTNRGERLEGDNGNDRILGLEGKDTLIGNGGNDELDGGNANDELFGGRGDDLLLGGNGSDLLDGGAGHDTLTGGRGSDIFVLQADGTPADADIVTDFGLPDRIEIRGAQGKQITFAQDGVDTLIEADGVLVARILDTKASLVALTAEYDAQPASVDTPRLSGMGGLLSSFFSSVFGQLTDMLQPEGPGLIFDQAQDATMLRPQMDVIWVADSLG